MKEITKTPFAVMKDVIKFYGFLVVFLGISFLGIKLYTHLVDPFQVDMQAYDGAMGAMGDCAVALACLAALFSVPPKSLMHAALFAVAISLTGSAPFLYDSFLAWAWDCVRLAGCVLLAWGFSCAWANLHGKRD